MFSFAQPWMLLGLAGLALPVIAHMIHLRSTVVRRFPSVRFILPSSIPQRGTSRPVDLLLLLLRLLLLGLAVVALAGPQWVPPANEPDASGNETIILLDRSSSTSGWGTWAEATAAAEEVARAAEGRVGLVAYAGRVQTTLAPSAERTPVLDALAAAAPTGEGGQPQAAVDTALDLFTPGAPAKTLVICSDFQLPDWQDVSAVLGERGVGLVLRRAGAGDRGDNFSILRAHSSPAGGGGVRVSVSLANFSPRAQERTVRLKAGAIAQEQSVSLVGDGRSQVQFVIPRGEEKQGTVSLDGADPYTADDTYYFWIQAPPARAVEIILPPIPDPVTETEAFFLRAALLSTAPGEWQSFALAPPRGGILGAAAVPDAAAVFVPGLSAEKGGGPTLEMLKTYLEGGGTVIATLGEGAAETLTALGRAGLMEATFRGAPGRARDRRDPFRITGVRPGHPLDKIFEGEPRKDLLLTQLSQYVKAQPRGATAAVLETSGGDPVLLEAPVGAGRFSLFTFRLEGGWTDLPLRNSFLPLVRELVLATTEEPAWPELAPGDSLPGAEGVFSAAEPGLFAFEDTLVSVNIPRSESVPDTVREVDLRAALGAPEATPGGGENVASAPADQPPPRPLWIWPALLALACFLAEGFIVRPRREAGVEVDAGPEKTDGGDGGKPTPGGAGGAGVSETPAEPARARAG